MDIARFTDVPLEGDLVDNDAGDQPHELTPIGRTLRAIRSHLGLDVAYVSKFVGNESVFQEVDAPGLEHLIKPGDSRSLNDVYCTHILEGRLPELIPDTSENTFAMSLPITQQNSIGAHLSVPIKLPDGRPYGMFCCLGFKADKSLNDRDLKMMKAFAEVTAFEINRDIETETIVSDKRDRIRTAIDREQISAVFQPIWDVDKMRVVSFESLSRFAALPYRSPDEWFNEAADIGMGVTLELEAIGIALRSLSKFPPRILVGLNTSPQTVLDEGFREIFGNVAVDRVVIEITEHADVEDYEKLLDVLRPLRERGLRLAIDDAGAGYSSLRHILNLKPDFIKLDIGLTQNIDLDPARKALARALIGFARDTGSRIVAEGVERQSELETLRSIGVSKVQGYLLGKPMSLDEAAALVAIPSGEKSSVAA